MQDQQPRLVGTARAVLFIAGLLVGVSGVAAGEAALWSNPRLGSLGLWRPLADTPALGLAPQIEIPVLRSDQSAAPEAVGGRRRTLMPALMSALVPGAGQLRNGTILRGVGFMAAEIAGWVAFAAFGQGAENKYEDIEGFADQYWSYANDEGTGYSQYQQNYDPNNCVHSNRWSSEADSLIKHLGTLKNERYHEYLTRDDYVCGWNSAAQDGPRYEQLWKDREDLRDARKFTAEMIGLNHLAAAIDAFLVARNLRLEMGGAELKFRAAELANGFGPQVMIEKRFD